MQTYFEELLSANHVLQLAINHAQYHNACQGDHSAAAVAILAQALILATPELSHQSRSALLIKGVEE